MNLLVTILKSSLKDIFANKTRSFLTMLGIIIGIASVILVTAIGTGAQQLIISQVTKVGTNLIGILPGKSEEEGPPIALMGVNITTLTNEDAQAIRKLPYIEAVSSYVSGNYPVTFSNQSQNFDIAGVSADYINVEDTSLEQGYFFSQNQINRYAKVAVLGHEVAQELFNGANPLGKRIRIKNVNFEVIGLFKKRGSYLFGNFDSQVFVPVTTAQKSLVGINHVAFIRARMQSGANEKLVEKEIETLLRFRHRITDPDKDDFSVRTMAQLLSILKQVTGAIQSFLILVVAISLIVGGIGIMNIMLVSLSERIREVGLRKALGATDNNILIQFLAESTLIALLAGLIGVASGLLLGWGISYAIRLFTNLEWYFIISFSQIILAAGVAMMIGMIFGLYPARKAAHLDPIEALRYE
jgi:putative ABC transport system permease protein